MDRILTDHEERHGEVLAARGLHGAEDGADHGAADADECDHDDEPADADGLAHRHAAAALGVPRLLGRGRGLGPGLRIGVLRSETERGVN